MRGRGRGRGYRGRGRGNRGQHWGHSWNSGEAQDRDLGAKVEEVGEKTDDNRRNGKVFLLAQLTRLKVVSSLVLTMQS